MSQKSLLCSFAVLTLAITAGCASQSPQSNNAATTQPVSTASIEPSEAVNEDQERPAPALAPIAPETLYDLLIAEMGGKVNRLEIALGNYMRQAHLTKDPAVIERYARIASYMQAHQATLDATKLWISTDPTNVDALHLMLTHQIEQGNGKHQETALRELLTQTDQLNLLIIEQQLNNSPDTQRAQFHDVITRLFADKSNNFKRYDQLWYLKAKTNSLNGNHQTVVSDIQSLQKLNDDFLPAYILLVDAYEKTGELEKAQKSLKRLTEIDPNNKKIRIYHTRLLIKLRKFEAANKEFKELLTLFPDDLDLKLTAGVLAAQTKRHDEAQSLFQTLIDAPHRTNEAHIQMALLHSAQGNNEKAIQHFLKVTPSPFYQEARFNAARLLAQAGQMEKAIQALAVGARAQPALKHVYTISAAELFVEHKQYKEGLKYLNQAIKQYPEEVSLIYSRAILHNELDDFATSESDLRQVLKMKPDNVAALNALGYTLVDRNIRLDEAQILLEQANTLSPNDPPILDSLGWLEYRLGNLTKAKQYLKDAYNRLQDHEIAAHLGEVLWVSGEQEEALKLWKEGLQLKPNSTVIQETMKRFSQ